MALNDSIFSLELGPKLEYSAEEVSAVTQKEFVVGKVYSGGEKELMDDLRSFANKFLFSIAKRGRREARCSQASNSWSRKVKRGEYELQRASSSQTSNCEYCINVSTGKVTKINRVYSLHNHPCDVPTAVAVVKKSGKAISMAIDQVSEILVPWIRGNNKIDCNTVRKTIEPYIENDVVLSDVTSRSILRGITDRMTTGKCKVPKPIISQDMLRSYMSIDYSSKNSAKILQDILKNANTNGENSWIVLRLI